MLKKLENTRKLAAYGGLCSPIGYEDGIKYVGICSMWNYLENMFVQNIKKGLYTNLHRGIKFVFWPIFWFISYIEEYIQLHREHISTWKKKFPC